MKKVLIIINGYYPYDKSEDYLSNEMEYINGFDKVLCFPTLIFGKKKPEDIKYYPLPPQSILIRNSERSFKKRLFMSIINTIFHKYFFEELLHISFKRHFFSRLKSLLRCSFQGICAYFDLKKIILEIQNSNDKVNVYLYSYWMVNTALTSIFLKKDKSLYSIKATFTRCHRFDVYDYASVSSYIPYRKYILSNIDKIFSISIDAKQYLEKKYFPFVKNKISISRLGTFDHGVNILNKDGVLRVLSCSWLRPVKRVNLIFQALDKLDIPIEWTHYGDGEDMDVLLNLISKKKNKKLFVNMPGAKTNKEILELYKTNHFDLFVNVSKNEGVPVSIMEAMSFGKIIIATNVGGTSEIVKNGENGFLLPENFNIDQLAEKFLIIYNMKNSDYKQMCLKSRFIWEDLSNAELNYKKFYKQLMNL